MEERISILTYAVRPRVVLKYVGQLGLMLSLLAAVPLIVALLEGDGTQALRYAIVCCFLLVAGIYLARLPAPARMQGNEALTITALAFLIAPLLMSWPMMAAGIPFTDALFEAISGVTTTGLSTVGNIEQHSATFLFARAWMQWYGGLGIVVLSVAILMGHHIAARRLIEPVESGDTFVSTARTHAQRTLVVYLFITVLGFAIVWPQSRNGFSTLLHVFSAVSTGGYSSFEAGLAGMGRNAAIAVMFVAFLGAISMPLYWRAIDRGFAGGIRSFFTDVEFRMLLIGCLLMGGILSGLAWLHNVNAPWYHGMLMGVSAQTTTGFSTMPVSELDPVSKVLMIVSMLTGGSVGSSAGGFKLLRLLIFLRMLHLYIRQSAMPPHAVAEPYIAGQKLDSNDMLRAMQLILLYIGIVVLSWIPFVLMGYDPLDALFEVASACGTVGLSTGITRPDLELLLKSILCFDMLAGRLEVVALLVILYPRNWIGRREETP
jgi:trk system potassium uptake protein TrkH